MLKFFNNSEAPTSKDLDIAAAEDVWAFHTIQENHSFRSKDRASKLIHACFEPKFACARPKSKAIVVANVLTPTAMKELKDDLNKYICITILNAASNRGKLCPIVVHNFQLYVGVQVKFLDLQDQPGEISDTNVNYLNQVLTDNNLTTKVVAFCGDNANVNFGGAARRGANNVLTKLQSSLKKSLIGCGAHVIHNAIKSAADRLPFRLLKYYCEDIFFFYIYTIRVKALKELICAETETEYQQKCSSIAKLALMPALERVLKMYQSLKNYFLSIEKCPLSLKNFFEDPNPNCGFIFLEAQSASFHQAVLKIEEAEDFIKSSSFSFHSQWIRKHRQSAATRTRVFACTPRAKKRKLGADEQFYNIMQTCLGSMGKKTVNDTFEAYIAFELDNLPCPKRKQQYVPK
ncbi:uncharacterized protein TNCT_701371 [Trichonephila clavata]|uniref:Uncharacterized protein n=1 Tax=Trichonephila clavata TaxID=2740835 RepID=A0A8X6J630_TRICU|nr:uncharacterized protein TNCT_701371 [Trichonephila clavata]